MKFSLTLLAAAILCLAPASAEEWKAPVPEGPAMETTVAVEAQTSVEVTEPEQGVQEQAELPSELSVPIGSSPSIWGVCSQTCQFCLSNSDCPLFLGRPQKCLAQCL